MRKKCVSLFLTLALLSCWSFGVSAEALQGKSGMKVSFDGRSMKANYKLADLTKTAVNLLPGDSVTYEMRLENESGSTAEMYCPTPCANPWRTRAVPTPTICATLATTVLRL